MDEHLKQWIQQEAADLDKWSTMSAAEYVERAALAEGDADRNAHARQLGGVQVLSKRLLGTLKQAGLYVPEEVQE